jgi:hypothetical protein
MILRNKIELMIINTLFFHAELLTVPTLIPPCRPNVTDLRSINQN